MKKTLTVFGIILMAASVVCAQNAPPKPVSLAAKTPVAEKASALPVITDAQKAKFFKAQVAFQNANSQVEHTQAAMQAAVNEMKSVCGDKAQLTLDQTGDPACVAVPKPTK